MKHAIKTIISPLSPQFSTRSVNCVNKTRHVRPEILHFNYIIFFYSETLKVSFEPNFDQTNLKKKNKVWINWWTIRGHQSCFNSTNPSATQPLRENTLNRVSLY